MNKRPPATGAFWDLYESKPLSCYNGCMPTQTSSRLVQTILLLGLVLGGGAFWWSLRSERLAQRMQPAVLVPSQVARETIAVDSTVAFEANESEISNAVQNFPDFSPLPTNCSPFKQVAAYSGVATNQAETVITWDTSVISTQNPEKLQRLLSLGETLDSLVEKADSNTHRLPLQGEWDQESLLPWNDPNCLTIIPTMYPVLIKDIMIPKTDQAWYLESFDVIGNVELPITRRLFIRQGSRWIVVSELQSTQQELDIESEAMFERLETTCKTSEDELPDVVACAAQIWFGEYRKPEVAKQWISEISARIKF